MRVWQLVTKLKQVLQRIESISIRLNKQILASSSTDSGMHLISQVTCLITGVCYRGQ